MSDHEHKHDEHCGRQSHPDQPWPSADPAQQGLADALKVSFRVLAGIMIIVVAMFLLTGVKIIEPHQTAIIKFCGKVVRTSGQGLVFTWPFPIGEVEIVNSREFSLDIDDFWMHETPEDSVKELDQRQTPEGGLRPGWDGALLTGDHSLLHIKMSCYYSVPGAVACRRSLGDETRAVVAAVGSAAIRTAAGRTADAILRSGQDEFTAQVLLDAQNCLDAVTGQAGAVVLRKITVRQCTVPLQSRQAYNAAQNAAQESDRIRSEAIAEATKTLNAAAGDNYTVLVGELWNRGNGTPDEANYNLIGQYEAARRAGRTQQAADLMRKIDEFIAGSRISGQASAIIAQAHGRKTAALEAVGRRVNQFRNLQPQYLAAGRIMLERLWADTRESILAGTMTEKFYVMPGDEKTVIRITRDPKIAREIQRTELRKPSGDETPPGTP